MTRITEYVRIITDRLEILYTEASCSLEFESPLHLLIATQLAAQCTDKRVNIITQEMFKYLNTVEDYANAPIEIIEDYIKSAGLYKNKAKNIKATCTKIINDYNGQVPDNMEDLLTLPGVGRKTANVVLGDAFGIPGIVVDTHAGRLALRMGLTKNTDPAKVERDLMKIIPKEKWTNFCHRLVYFGRDCCKAQRPLCAECVLNDVCPKNGTSGTADKKVQKG